MSYKLGLVSTRSFHFNDNDTILIVLNLELCTVRPETITFFILVFKNNSSSFKDNSSYSVPPPRPIRCLSQTLCLCL